MKKKIKYKSRNHKFAGGGAAAAIPTFDSLAQKVETTIDSSRSGYSEQPKVIQEGILGAQDGTHIGRMWTAENKTQEALKYIKDLGDVSYATTNTEDLLAQRSSTGSIRRANIDTTGTEATAAIFDPLSMGLRKLISYTGPKYSHFGDSAAQRQERINNEISRANSRRDAAFSAAVDNLEKQRAANMMYNYSAFGGPLDTPSFGATGYDVAKDNAYNDLFEAQSKNSTSFTPIFNSPSTYSFGDGGGLSRSRDYKSESKPYPSVKSSDFAGSGRSYPIPTRADAIDALRLAGLHHRPDVKAKVYAKYPGLKHAEGGMLMSDYFNNGVTMVDQGGTHENNPHEGVQMGVAPDGKPNLVEEGEAIYKDYVFSNRLRVPKEVRNKYKLRGPKDMTFAEAFRKAQEESEERPNDPISEEGLENMAMVLARTQEAVRGYEKAGRKAAKGGYLFAKGSDLNNALKEAQDDMNLATLLAMADVDKELDAFNTYGTDRLIREQELENLLGAGNPELIAKAELPKGFQPITKKSSDKDTDKKETWRFNPSGLRYADIAANAAAVFGDLMGITNNPTVYDQIPPFQAVGFNPLGNYIPVTHFDTRYAANQAAQQAAATRAAIMQSALPSRYANLLAADYNAQIANGDLLMKAALDDYDRAVKREEFNRGTNQTNSQLGLQAAMANQDARLRYAQSALQQAKMNTDETNATMGAKAANISALAESLSNVGREADAKAWRDMLIRAGVYGTLPEKPTDWSPEQWADYQKYIAKYRSSSTAAKGGKIRKKKGLTY